MHLQNNPSSTSGKEKYSSLKVGGLLYAVLLCGFIIYKNQFFYHDDAYITLRYVRNFLNGSGIVWNAGEYVQGYSNFLHLILISFLGKFNTDLVLASQLIGFAALGGLFIVMLWFGLTFKVENKRPLWHLPAILLATSVPLVVWSIGGLEGTLFSFLIALGSLLFVKGLDSPESQKLFAASGSILGLSLLTRPDGIVFIAVSSAYLLLLLLTNEKKRKPLFNLLIFGAALAIIVLPYVSWELFYYGDIVPNTFYAKTGSLSWTTVRSGFIYLAKYATQPPFLPVLVLFVLYYVTKKRMWNHKLVYLTLLIFGYGSFIIYVGGDHMPAYRFLLPVIPLMIVLLSMVLSHLLIKKQGRVNTASITMAFLFLATLSLFDLSLNPLNLKLHSLNKDAAAQTGAIVGKYIAEKWPEGSLIALSTAGSTPYFAENYRYIDMLGLNDAHIAKRPIEKIELNWQNKPGHLKGDGAYIMYRQPDFIIAGPAHGTEVEKPWFLSDLELSRIPKFKIDYEMQKIAIKTADTNPHEGSIIFTYYRKKDK